MNKELIKIKVKCAFVYISDGLTKGKEYEVLRERGVFFEIKDDNAVVKCYPRSRFERQKS